MAENTCADCTKDVGVAPLECKRHRVCSGCLVKRSQQRHPTRVLKCHFCKSSVRTETHVQTSPTSKIVPEQSYKAALQSEGSAVQPVARNVGGGATESADHHSDSEAPAKVGGKLPGIHIFVDDSNIWIEAKKLHAKKYKTLLNEDPRVRIDMGKLADVLANGRPVEQGILYGSEPPPIDTVWKKIEEKAGWTVKSKRRDMITGKEKQIDTNLVADVTATAIRTPVEERTTIVLVTGDANVLPALEKVLEEKQWTIEVYMWKDALSKQLIYYGAKNQRRVEIVPLDSYLDHLAFTNMKFSVSSRDYLLRTVTAHGVVFTMEAKAFKRRVPTKKWFNQLENIAQWPFRYYWFESKTGEQTDDLVIVFPPYPEARQFDVTKFLKNIKADSEDDNEGYRLPLVVEAYTFHQFMAKQKEKEQDQNSPIKVMDAVLEEVGLLDRDDIDSGYEDYAVCFSEEDDSSEWTVVKRRYRPRRQKFSDPCRYGMHCTQGTQCPFKHSDEDKVYFKKRGGPGNPYRKVKPCKFYEKKACWRSKEDCDGAHGEEDAHCLACGEGGHFTDNCKRLKTNDSAKLKRVSASS